MTIVALAAVTVLGVWGVMLYNLLVRDRARVAAAWSDVEVQLKRRHDLIPKLVDAVKQHAGYERAVLESVVARRASALSASGPVEKGAPEASLGRKLHRLIAVAEDYPELKATTSGTKTASSPRVRARTRSAIARTGSSASSPITTSCTGTSPVWAGISRSTTSRRGATAGRDSRRCGQAGRLHGPDGRNGEVLPGRHG